MLILSLTFFVSVGSLGIAYADGDDTGYVEEGDSGASLDTGGDAGADPGASVDLGTDSSGGAGSYASPPVDQPDPETYGTDFGYNLDDPSDPANAQLDAAYGHDKTNGLIDIGDVTADGRKILYRATTVVDGFKPLLVDGDLSFLGALNDKTLDTAAELPESIVDAIDELGMADKSKDIGVDPASAFNEEPAVELKAEEADVKLGLSDDERRAAASGGDFGSKREGPSVSFDDETASPKGESQREALRLRDHEDSGLPVYTVNSLDSLKPADKSEGASLEAADAAPRGGSVVPGGSATPSGGAALSPSDGVGAPTATGDTFAADAERATNRDLLIIQNIGSFDLIPGVDYDIDQVKPDEGADPTGLPTLDELKAQNGDGRVHGGQSWRDGTGLVWTNHAPAPTSVPAKDVPAAVAVEGSVAPDAASATAPDFSQPIADVDVTVNNGTQRKPDLTEASGKVYRADPSFCGGQDCYQIRIENASFDKDGASHGHEDGTPHGRYVYCTADAIAGNGTCGLDTKINATDTSGYNWSAGYLPGTPEFGSNAGTYMRIYAELTPPAVSTVAYPTYQQLLSDSPDGKIHHGDKWVDDEGTVWELW